MFKVNPGDASTLNTTSPRCLWKIWRDNLLLFCSVSVYVEICLHLCVYRSLDHYAVYLLLFGLLGGALSSLLVSCLPRILRLFAGFLLVAAQVLFAETQLVYQAIFGNFMPINQISMEMLSSILPLSLSTASAGICRQSFCCWRRCPRRSSALRCGKRAH